jgi:predicted NUDIX family phosphoesterase
MIADNQQEILVFPRKCIADCERFIQWHDADGVFQSVEGSMTWLSRSEAEKSEDWVQPIPCAVVCGESGKYYVFRRIKEGRADLSSRLSLVVGGHIDWDSEHETLSSLVMTTLEREIAEELGVTPADEIKPVGLVIDWISVEASRHVALVHEVAVAGHVRPKAIEEFSSRSTYNGQLYTPDELSKFRKEFDPWSTILFGDYINPSYSLDVGQQPSLFGEVKPGAAS